MSVPASGRAVGSVVAEEPVQDDDKPDLGGWMQRLCRAATRELSASGMGMSVMSPEGAFTVLAGSSPVSETIEQLQFTLGEGPCLDAYAFGRPVLTPDLSHAATRRWPGYAPAAMGLGVHAVFAFPLQVGAARLGAMDVFREQTGSLPNADLAPGPCLRRGRHGWRCSTAQEHSEVARAVRPSASSRAPSRTRSSSTRPREWCRCSSAPASLRRWRACGHTPTPRADL